MAGSSSSKSGSSARKAGMNVDIKMVRELAEMLGETGLTEIEVEDGDRKVRVSRGATATVSAAPAAIAAAPAPAAPASTAAEQSAPAADNHADAMKSPMVGTVYLSAEPGAPPFKNVGDAVKKGDTVLIVEAMKVMNPIVADRDGTLKSILVDNAQPIEFGQPLLVIA